MAKIKSEEQQSLSPIHRRDLSSQERWDLDRRRYWESAVFPLEWSSASLVDGLAVPVVGERLDIALDHSIKATIAMMEHRDPNLRWTDDTGFFLDGTALAVVRNSSQGPMVTRFDPIASLPIEAIKPGRRASRRSSITWVDGSFESAGYGLGIPLERRDLDRVLEESIRSISEEMTDGERDSRQADDVMLTYRGRILVVIRTTKSGPTVTRFDRPV
jgi:hypothetical protein